jgi:thioredoxin 1
MIHVSDQNFNQSVLQSNKPVLVDFYADWCGPCRMLAPVLNEVHRELGNEIVIAKVNVDDNPVVSSTYGIMSIPTLKLFSNGKVIQTVIGFQSKAELVRLVKDHVQT